MRHSQRPRCGLFPTLNTDSLITINMAKGSVLASRLPVGFILGDRASGTGLLIRVQLSGTSISVRRWPHRRGRSGSFKSVTFDLQNSTLVLGGKRQRFWRDYLRAFSLL